MILRAAAVINNISSSTLTKHLPIKGIMIARKAVISNHSSSNLNMRLSTKQSTLIATVVATSTHLISSNIHNKSNVSYQLTECLHDNLTARLHNSQHPLNFHDTCALLSPFAAPPNCWRRILLKKRGVNARQARRPRDKGNHAEPMRARDPEWSVEETMCLINAWNVMDAKTLEGGIYQQTKSQPQKWTEVYAMCGEQDLD
eukprot:jgi/Chlat1/7791/Chrsp66S07256